MFKTMNLTMLTDFYEITMANGYLEAGIEDEIAYFDMFFRKVPDGGGFAIMAGIEQVVDYLDNLKFTEEDIEYLRSKGQFLRGVPRVSSLTSSSAAMCGQLPEGNTNFST